MNKLLLALLLLIPTTALGQVKAVINAPTESNLGDLVILDSTASVGDNRLWVTDEQVAGRYLIIDERIVFAIGTPGDYTFQLIVADTNAEIDQVTHTVQVGRGQPPPDPPTDPDPEPPTDPDPEPPTNQAVYKAVKAATGYMNDPDTANQLRQALSSLQEKTPAAAQKAIAEVFLKRKDQSKDWLNDWRVPVNKAIEDAKLPYEEVLKQIIAGLDPSLAGSPSTVIIYVRDNCPPCELWKKIELPKLLALGWKVEEKQTATKPTPTFQIQTYGREVEIEGYLSYESFSSIVQRMRD